MQLITGKTKLLGVIGDPVEHSLSPIMHNAVSAALDFDYVYVPLPVARGDLHRALSGFEAINLVGFNLTIPHKQAILPLLTEVSATAQRVGAVNTVWRSEAGWNGTNTDVAGFLAPLKTFPRDWSQMSPVVLGNGGAARAVVAGCIEIGCQNIHVVGRNQEKLKDFQRSWSDSSLKVHLQSELPQLLKQSGLVINTTPIGMFPNTNQSPLTEELIQWLQPEAIAYDLIYTPNPTLFLQQAQKRGAIAIDGLEMLVQQGAAALEIWLQQTIPVEVMRQSLRQYLELDG